MQTAPKLQNDQANLPLGRVRRCAASYLDAPPLHKTIKNQVLTLVAAAAATTLSATTDTAAALVLNNDRKQPHSSHHPYQSRLES